MKAHGSGDFKVTVDGLSATVEGVKWVSVQASAKITALTVQAGSSRNTANNVYEMGKDGKGRWSSDVKLDGTQTIFVSAALSESGNAGFVPHQAVVSFRRLSDDVPLGVPRFQTVYFPPPLDGGELNLAIPLSNRKLLVAYDGEYEVSVLFGDSRLKKQISQTLGNVHFHFSASAELTIDTADVAKLPLDAEGMEGRNSAALPLQRQNTAAIANGDFKYFGAKAPIEHLFRKPEKRPNPLISTVFLGAIVAVFALFNILLMAKWNANLFLSKSKAGLTGASAAGATTTSMAFMGLLLSAVAGLWNFFFFSTLAHTGIFLIAMLTVVYTVGNRELSASKEARWMLWGATTKAVTDGKKDQ